MINCEGRLTSGTEEDVAAPRVGGVTWEEITLKWDISLYVSYKLWSNVSFSVAWVPPSPVLLLWGVARASSLSIGTTSVQPTSTLLIMGSTVCPAYPNYDTNKYNKALRVQVEVMSKDLNISRQTWSWLHSKTHLLITYYLPLRTRGQNWSHLWNNHRVKKL